MSAVFQTYINTPPVENSVLYSLLFFINGIGDTLVIDTDTQIRNIEENILTCSVHIIEMILGIEVTDDILANKKTFLLIKARELADPEQLQLLQHYYSSEDFVADEKIRSVKKIFHDLEIDKMTVEKVHEYSIKALNILAGIPVDGSRKVELEKFTRNLMDRIR